MGYEINKTKLQEMNVEIGYYRMSTKAREANNKEREQWKSDEKGEKKNSTRGAWYYYYVFKIHLMV